MRKLTLFALAAVTTMMTAATPLSVQAREISSYCGNGTNGGCVVITNSNGCQQGQNIQNEDVLSYVKDELAKRGLENCIPSYVIPQGSTCTDNTCDNAGTDDTCTDDTCTPDQGEVITPDGGKADESGNVDPNGSKPAGEEPAGSEATDEGTAELTYAQQVVKLVNVERVKAGLSELAIDEKTEAAALVRAKEIKQSFSHTRPNGSQFSTVLKEQGVSYRGAGENIAWGQKSPEEVVTAWMNSEGHRANILNAKFTHIGVGYYQDAKGTNYWSQLFTY